MLIAQVLTVQDTEGWAKAGVMFRDDTAAGAMFAMVVATPGDGVNFCFRTATGAVSSYAEIAGPVAPVWVQLLRSGNTFTASYSPDGVNWTAVGPPQVVPMSSQPLAGLAVTAHNNSLLCQATFSSVTISNVPPPPPPALGVYRQLWTGLTESLGNTLTVLTNTTYNPNWPNNPAPAYTTILTSFQTGVNTGMNDYGQRLRAFLVPPQDGNYTFWISSDDTSDLFVSTDENPADDTIVAAVTSWTPSLDWTAESTQQSAPMALQSGRRYYVEALQQQGGGGDNLAVAWSLPDGTFEGPIGATSPAGTWVIPYDGTLAKPGIYLQSGNFTVIEGETVKCLVICTNHASLAYQWRLNGTAVAGPNATNASFGLTNVSVAANNGQVYTCVISNSAGAITSAPIALTVLSDTVRPMVSSVASIGSTNVSLIFSKPISAASATNAANYVFTNGLPVTGALLATDLVTVTLTTAPLTYSSNYWLVINNIRDRATVPNSITPNTTVHFLAAPFTGQDIGNPPTGSVVAFVGGNGLSLTASGSGIGGSSDQFGFEYQPRTGNFDVSAAWPGSPRRGCGPSGPHGPGDLGGQRPVCRGSRHARHGGFVLRLAPARGQPGEHRRRLPRQLPEHLAPPQTRRQQLHRVRRL